LAITFFFSLKSENNKFINRRFLKVSKYVPKVQVEENILSLKYGRFYNGFNDTINCCFKEKMYFFLFEDKLEIRKL